MAREAEAREFVMSFVSSSETYRQQFVEKWQEVLANFIVDGAQSYNTGGFRTPYSRDRIYKGSKSRIMLKDPETHKLVMVYASKLMRSLFGDNKHEYIQAAPVGYEDDQKSQTVTRLLRYGWSLPGHFRTLVETIVDMLLFGTSVVELGWHYEEREMVVRTVEYGLGIESSTTMQARVPVYDDPLIRPIDIMDFYPDPARYRIQEMSGAAKRFRMNSFEARRMAATEIYSSAAVEEAINNGKGSDPRQASPDFRAGLDQPAEKHSAPDFRDMTGYEYFGMVPWEEDGSTRRVITVLNNVVVRNDPFPYADANLPFHTFIINPVQGRFYGISPAEVIRYDQSFADAMKMLLAEAIVRQVHPPIAYDPDADPDVAAIKAWKADALIAVRGGPASIGTVKYSADIQAGFAMMQGLKSSIQEGSGMLGGISGENGPDREAASVGVQRIQMALDRPELAAMVIENECLPPIGRAMLARFQQFILDTDDLKKRIGELPEPVWLGDIMGDYDVRFVGSRMVASRQMKLQSFDRLMGYAQVSPAFQAFLPNIEIAQTLIGDWMELPELAAAVGDPKNIQANIMAAQMMGQPNGANNGVPTSSEPAGMMPAQASGGPQGGG